MDYHDPNASDLLKRQVAEAVTFDYTEEDWIKIEKSVRHLRPTQADLKHIHTRLRLHIRTYLFAELNRPGKVTKNKWITKHWARIAKLSDDTLKSLVAVAKLEGDAGPPGPDGRPPPERYREHKFALMKLIVFARGRLDAPKIDDGFPKASSRGWFQFDVLEIWTELGGQLRISRHPRTKKITGPLARYFAAVTGPIPAYRGSLESLPDILTRQKSMMLKIARYNARAFAEELTTKLRSLEEMPDEP